MGRGGLAGALILVGLILATAVGCGSPAPTPSDVAIASDSPAPVEGRAALDQCMAAAGYTVRPGRSGSNLVYSWESSSSYTWDVAKGMPNAEAAATCEAKFAPPRDKTEAELREIYERWILERGCLISLGFTTRKPPTFEAFQRGWRTGPWMPIDGIPFDRLRGEPKRVCGLEMID